MVYIPSPRVKFPFKTTLICLIIFDHRAYLQFPSSLLENLPFLSTLKPSRELPFPTLGKGKSSSKLPVRGDMLVKYPGEYQFPSLCKEVNLQALSDGHPPVFTPWPQGWTPRDVPFERGAKRGKVASCVFGVGKTVGFIGVVYRGWLYYPVMRGLYVYDMDDRVVVSCICLHVHP